MVEFQLLLVAWWVNSANDHFSGIWWNLDKYIWQFGDKYFLQVGQINFRMCSWVGQDIDLRANNNFSGIRRRPRFFRSDWSWKEAELGFVPVFRSNLWIFLAPDTIAVHSCTSLMVGDTLWPIWCFWRRNDNNGNQEDNWTEIIT